MIKVGLCAVWCAATVLGEYAVDDAPGLGLRWEGVGAISGGGATSKLLIEYPEQQRSDVLDFLFKPNYGLGLQILKVEIGGDTDSTEGAEPSHMHSQGDENYQRGYEWWLMKEAKSRNPQIKLYGLPWGFPGWLDPSATADKAATNAFADANLTANYTLAWLLGAKREHGLTIDYVGQWNERNAPVAYNDALREAVAKSDVADSTTVLNRLPHYPGTKETPDSKGCTQYAWNTTDGSRWVDEEGSIFDGRSARCLARCVNRNYISGCHTATFQWHLVSSFYDYLPWARDGVAVANQPWSGAFEITSPTWSLAHTSQFAPIGWRYAAHGAGVTMLEKGGSMVTRVSPDMHDLSIVVEKMSSANSHCARGNNPTSDPTSEELVIAFHGAFLKAAQRGLNVWYSNLTSSNSQGVNPPDDQLFQKRPMLKLNKDGTLRLTVAPEEIFTLTTLNVGGKGAAKSPAATPFPIPFEQSFDDEESPAPPRIWYDQMGAWEVQSSPYGDVKSHGNVMRQVSPVWPACWGYSCSGPTTYFGPSELTGDLMVSVDVHLEDHAQFIMDFLDASNKDTTGFGKLILDSAGNFSLGHTSGNLAFAPGRWHHVELRMGGPSGSWQTVAVDGTSLANISLGSLESGADDCSDSAFPLDLAGKQALGLQAGPQNATSLEACRQACCDMGSQCEIYQFSQSPSILPNCWLGQSNNFKDDKAGVYTSRARAATRTPWHIKVQLSRYIFASMDNFKITHGEQLAPAVQFV